MRSAALYSPDGTVTGAVEVFHDDAHARAVADRLDRAEREALIDPLTGVSNRRLAERILAGRENEHQRYDRGYAVVFCDVDRFKRVNDDYGYETGDNVLRVVARTLRDSTRPSDTVGRWGGDEFVVIVPAAGEDQAVFLADRIRNAVSAERAWEHAGLVVTLSMGVAVASPGEGGAQVVARASEAMRQAKKDGGDQTWVERVGTGPTAAPKAQAQCQ